MAVQLYRLEHEHMLGLCDLSVPCFEVTHLQLTPYLSARLACAKVSKPRQKFQFPAALLYLHATSTTDTPLAHGESSLSGLINRGLACCVQL